jgi:hypothetical protein
MVEIRKFTDIIGVILTEDIVDGRIGMLTAAPSAQAPFNVYGLREDLPGVKLPTSDAESKKARYVVKWAKDNRPTPLFYPMPYYSWVVRNYGFESGQSSPSGRNLPMTSTTVYLMHPQVQEGLTIPSGELGLAYAGGVFTFYSGEFVYSADIETIGNPVGVEYTDGGANQGKPQYDADGEFGIVELWDDSEFAVTVRTLVP